MARIHPGHPERLLPLLPHHAEVRTLRRLQKRLPETFAIYHSVHHSRVERGAQRFGEIDFVVVNAAGDVLLIEQKNGPLVDTGETLVKQYEGRTRDVVSQVLGNHAAVMGQLTEVFGGRPPIAVKVLLYCPDHRVQSAGTSGLARSQIIDATQPRELETWIVEHLGEGLADAEVAQQVRTWAGRMLRLEPDLAASIDLQESTYERMAGSLIELVEGLDMPRWRLRIQAAAGSGKSLAAMHMFRQARAEGRRPLMLCFNNLLGRAMQDALGESRDVGTFHEWCRRMHEADGGIFDAAAAASPDYWKLLVEQVIASELEAPRYDTFIIDEAQDFDSDWWQVLRVFEAADADIRVLCLEDEEQNIYGRSGPEIDDCVRFRSRVVYRTPQRIARFIDRVLAPDVEWRSPFDGFTPEICTWSDADEQAALVVARIDAMLERGFAADQILVLSMKGRDQALFHSRQLFGGHRIRKFTGRFSPEGVPQFTEGEITAETLRRFKGNQAPAVIVTDVELGHSDAERRLAYCALTRATVACDVLCRDVEDGLFSPLARAGATL